MAYGYYYEGDDIAGGVGQIDAIANMHGVRAETYKAQIKQLAWNFSIYNPANIKGWVDIIEGLTEPVLTQEQEQEPVPELISKLESFAESPYA